MNPDPFHSTLTANRAVIAAGGVSCCAYAYLALATQSGGQPPLVAFLMVIAACAGLSFVLCARHQHRGTQVSIGWMLGFAVVFRLIGVIGEPIFEDDFYRYLWDGYLLVETGTPYGVPPSAYFASDDLGDRFESILDQINHPDIATVYGPANQWFFALAYVLAPGQVWPLQLMLSAIDLAVVLMLLRMAKPNWVLLYAWCPLLVKEVAFTAHPDVLGVAFVVAGLLTARGRRWALTGALLALAAASKVFALILVPFLLRLHWRGWAAFVTTAVLVAAPFGVIAAWFPDGLQAMARDWLFNAPLYFALSPWLAFDQIKLGLLSAFVVGWALALYPFVFGRTRHQDSIVAVRGDVLFAAFFLCVPVVNAWYVVWLLPFGVLHPSRAVWAASAVLALSYVTGINTGHAGTALYALPGWIVALEVAVVGLALIIDARRPCVPDSVRHHRL